MPVEQERANSVNTWDRKKRSLTALGYEIKGISTTKERD